MLTRAALWNTYPPHDNYGILPTVHKQAILDLAYSIDSEVIYSVRVSPHPPHPTQPLPVLPSIRRPGP